MQEQAGDVDKFMESCVKELAARLLTLVIDRTLPGKYPKNSGKVGGTLRRGWTAKTETEAINGSEKGALAWVNEANVKRTGDAYEIEIYNPVHYASYVEYGHRTRDHKGFVPGKLMLTKSEMDLARQMPGLLEKKIKKFMEDTFKI